MLIFWRDNHCVKVSKYGVFSGLYFPVFELFTQCNLHRLNARSLFVCNIPHLIISFDRDNRAMAAYFDKEIKDYSLINFNDFETHQSSKEKYCTCYLKSF